MSVKRCIAMVLLLILVLSIGMIACAQPAPAPTPTPTPTPAPVSKQLSPLEQVIEGAKKEGSVTVLMSGEYPPEAMARLEKEIQQKFGVSLKISNVIGAAQPQEAAKAVMEYQTKAPPSYDLMNLTDVSTVTMAQAGALEEIDWKQLLIAGTNPDAIVKAVVNCPINQTELMGIVYNPQKITATEMPKTVSGLADPKWKGKVGMFNYGNAWAKWSWVMGKEKLLADLRSLMKNGAIPGRHAEVTSRYLLGEVWVALTSSSYQRQMVAKKMPTAFQNPGFVDVVGTCLSVRKGTKSPNAAKLIASYLASPEGAKFCKETGDTDNFYYPCPMFDIVQQGKKDGLKMVLGSDPGLVTYMGTEEYKSLIKEIGQIIETGK